MEYLNWIDWLIIGAYLVGVILFGSWLGRGQKTTRDYFLGSRQIPWWGVGMSIVATETSALTFIGVPALAYGGDILFIQMVVGYVIARVLLATFLVPRYFRNEIYSPYELFARHCGEGARRTAAIFFLIAGTLAAGVRVYVTCIPIQLLLGFDKSQIIWAILLFIGLALIYTYVGGIKAVVWTDAIQFGLFVVGGIFVLIYVPWQFEGGVSKVATLAHQNGKMEWFRGAFTLDLPYNIWMGVIGATFMACATHGVDQLIVQRVLSCRSVADGKKSLIFSAVIIFPLFLIFLFVGTALWAYYQQTPLPIALPETEAGISQNQYIFPIFIFTAVPPALKGLLIVGILSAAMSSVSSALSALASVSTMDLLKNWRGRRHNEPAQLNLSRHATLFWGAMLALVAYLSQQTTSILNLAFSLNGLTNGAMLGGILFVLIHRRARTGPVIFGMLLSLAMMSAIHFIPRSPLEEWWMESIGTRVAWPWYTLIGTAIMLVGGWLADLALPGRAREAPPSVIWY